MSYFDAISSTTSIGSSTSSTSATSDIMGKEDFLTLLVAQLQNQDPLNPDDPTEFTAQLAQFSSLEQLFNLNDSMNNLVTSNSNSDRLSTLQTIGKEVVYQDSNFEFDGVESVELGYQIDGPVTEIEISIQQNGSTIAVLSGEELTKGNHFITWDGTTDSGATASSGSYTITISAKAAEGQSVAASPLIKSEVIGVDLTGEYGGTLQTKAGDVGFNTIIGVYEKTADDAITEESEYWNYTGYSENSQTANENVASFTIPTNRVAFQEAVNNSVQSTADEIEAQSNSPIHLKLNY